MKLSTLSVLAAALLASQVQAATPEAAPEAPQAGTEVASIATPDAAPEAAAVDRISQQDLTTIQNFQLQAQNIRLQMQVLNRQLADVAAAQQAYVESVFVANKRGPEWTINTQSGAWEKKQAIQTADAAAAAPAEADPAAAATE